MGARSQIGQLTEENGFYKRKESIDVSIKKAREDLGVVKDTILDDVSSRINQKMYDLNKEIYIDKRRAPTLGLRGDKYSFNTYGDTGTGTAFANLISFDLAVMELTCLPAIIHDLPLLKNIENSALENIINIYCVSKKQIFIAIDKINSYEPKTAEIISSHQVLQLSKEKLLFLKNWKKED